MVHVAIIGAGISRLYCATQLKEKGLNIIIFESDRDIPDPTYFKCHCWPRGTHSWPTNINSSVIADKMIHPLPNIYICGDGFSHKQGWKAH
jgi:predicted NAD/FAD-dependent oxidoreductase